jgi:hypothetical protein
VQTFLAHHYFQQWNDGDETEGQEGRDDHCAEDDNYYPGPLRPDILEYSSEGFHQTDFSRVSRIAISEQYPVGLSETPSVIQAQFQHSNKRASAGQAQRVVLTGSKYSANLTAF